MKYLNIENLDVAGKKVLVRVDFNVPLSVNEKGEITVEDDTRIRAALPTINLIRKAGGIVILVSHLGRPKGEVQPELSLAPIAKHLSELIDSTVFMSPAVVGAQVEELAATLTPSEILLLENVRFEKGETKNSPDLAQLLANLADVFVNDAFGTSHRAHASTTGVALLVREKAAGLLLQRELETLSRIVKTPEHPFVAIVGGAKVSDKIGIIEKLLETVDHLLIGGAMAYTFLKAQGIETGNSLVEDDRLELARSVLALAGDRIHLPVDHVCSEEFSNESPTTISEGHVPSGCMGLDIGPKTSKQYAELIRSSKMIVWNGPMGVFEMSSFATGTNSIAHAVVEATATGAFSVVGGGDSVAAIVGAGLQDQVSHVSTGGGAMLELLEGKELPGVAALNV